ncbi:tRNA-uridine aminocarboxypropyltransferase [Litorilituus lipolyticus]|uniref:tRNA-uridine aminocarboxypropyltransferase n=1 Tax=Litorilituus lipolyticus TaxID=2491017 RepID=A0A502L1W1_9GAMM|nr:tRNA-uridine aminocarboxypropyltransferase [Litorilituus lipolyticus]TPH17204.1 DTW domain-containing protein [Litorilituus lipolyticus]
MHAVHHLYQYRKSLSTTTYKARGQRVIRCEYCRLAKRFCICSLAPKHACNTLQSNAGFLLLMYDTEVLKPSNTGKLIADIIPDTYAYLWSRTQENQELLALLNDEKWQPMIIFPSEYASAERKVQTNKVVCEKGKKPLFIMLDGSWREAKKMFRKSPYLNNFPLVSFDAKTYKESHDTQQSPVGEDSRYTVRKTELEHQFSTADVAARVLDMLGEKQNAKLLDLWFDVFNYQYQKSVCQRNKGNPKALENYQAYINTLS